MVAMWAWVLPLTACCLSLLPEYESRTGHVKVTNDLGIGGGLCQALLCFLHHLQMARRDLVQYGRKVTIEIPNSVCLCMYT